MVKTTTETQTKTATKSASSKPRGSAGKRAPSAYNRYVSEHLKLWRESNPDRPVKEAMSAVAAQWRDAPENPRRGQEPKKRGTKAPPAPTTVAPSRQSRRGQPAASDPEHAESSE